MLKTCFKRGFFSFSQHVHALHASEALWQTVSICFQSFTQCHIPKVVILSPLRYTVKTHRHTSEHRQTTNIQCEI